MAPPLSEKANPFTEDNVVITPALLYADTFNSKAPVAYQLVYDGIANGDITPETTVVVASSGNTGLGVAQLCKTLGLKCLVIMQTDTPALKQGAIGMLGDPVEISLINSGTVARARELGLQAGYYDTDQYARSGNLEAQNRYLAPQLWGSRRENIDVLVASGGTLGTIGGLQKYARDWQRTTKFIVALCDDGEEVPGARDEARITRDVKGISVNDFDGKLYGSRYESFLASAVLVPEIPWMPGGPTSGLAFLSTLRYINRHKKAGTLDSLRGIDGKVQVVFICPDDYRLYADLYRSVLHAEDFRSPFISATRLIGEAA
jgi:cysteine synthase